MGLISVEYGLEVIGLFCLVMCGVGLVNLGTYFDGYIIPLLMVYAFLLITFSFRKFNKSAKTLLWTLSLLHEKDLTINSNFSDWFFHLQALVYQAILTMF